MKRHHIHVALLFYVAINSLHALRKNGVAILKKLSGKEVMYISSLEKQNTVNNNNFKHLTLLKRKKKKKFILLKKIKDSNMLMTANTLHKGGKNDQMSNFSLCMLNQDRCDSPQVQACVDGTSDPDGANHPNGADNPDDGVDFGNKKDKEPTTTNKLEHRNEYLFPSSSGHDDGDDMEEDQGVKKKKKKKKKKKVQEGKGEAEVEEAEVEEAEVEEAEVEEAEVEEAEVEEAEVEEAEVEETEVEEAEAEEAEVEETEVKSDSVGSGKTVIRNKSDEEHPILDLLKSEALRDTGSEEKPVHFDNIADVAKKYVKKAEEGDARKLEGLDKEKMVEEYNRLVRTLKESAERKMKQYEENEKKNKYELNERVINSSRKLNLDKLKKEIEKAFIPNEALEKKIHDYMYMFTQTGDNSGIASGTRKCNGSSDDSTNEVNSGRKEKSPSERKTTEKNLSDDMAPHNIDSSTRTDRAYMSQEEELIQEHEEKENREILKRMYRGDYSGIEKFHFKFSSKDLEMMKNLDAPGNESEEERTLINGIFNKIITEKPVLNEIKEKEEKFLKLYEQNRRENKIERNEDIENLKYYNMKEMEKKRKKEEEERQRKLLEKKTKENVDQRRRDNDNTCGIGETTRENELIDKKIFFNKVHEKFVEIKEEEIEKMSESQTRDELRKRGYPTFGTLKEIKMRLQDVMRIKQNNEYDIRTIMKNPEKHVLSYIRLDKLKENMKQLKENEKYGDTESRIKELDAALEISNFVNDPVDYLRLDTTEKFSNQIEKNVEMDRPSEGKETYFQDQTEEKNEDLSKVPIVNDFNFDEQISMAEKLKKNFQFEEDERQPDRVVKYDDIEDAGNENSGSAIEMEEEKEELCRREVLKYGALQETINEFHSKHNLSLDFIGDFICKFSNASIHEINKYRKKTKEEIEKLRKNEFEFLISENSINNNFIVYKFVDINDLIKNYLTTKDIVTLIEYANVADPVDIIHFYSPETIFMLSDEYGITVDKVIDACTTLNIRLPYGGDTRLNMNCFNMLTTYLTRYVHT
ncbi:hypothetical protein, conserved [Plasmodium gonderi]|uniref:SAP domain-containing protein n=1 Tax=Plasmodium gonderi TaxID=77519 RepID=A0A1Y1JMH3_PLAGO|nr:hypothetical protein, conserved [Plasmodium gonderi]GAW83671.1 hypothetical protein, conserved [Plasmodium gonderi]